MTIKKTPDAIRQAQIRAELHRDIDLRQKSYRERALKLYPHVCARCGREFLGKRLKELTVHHKDHDHNNNPNDGSNWELLCLYCHDHEHEKYKIAGYYDAASDEQQSASTGFNPFDSLDALLRPNNDKPNQEKT
jgi:hypothetical protein